MNIEMELIIALLKLTKDGPVTHELISKEAKIPSASARKLLRTLQNGGLVYVRGDDVEADAAQRLRLAVHAVELCADLERVSSFLQWQEFEGMAAVALEQNGYSVENNLRFRHGGRKWEIDIVGCLKPQVICIDCKHWHRTMHLSALKKIVEEQVERTKALAETLPNPAVKIECVTWDNASFVPAVLSLVEGKFSFYENVPVVPVLKLQNFLSQLPAYAHSLRHFFKKANSKLIGST